MDTESAVQDQGWRGFFFFFFFFCRFKMGPTDGGAVLFRRSLVSRKTIRVVFLERILLVPSGQIARHSRCHWHRLVCHVVGVGLKGGKSLQEGRFREKYRGDD